jgi:hypothetical protein
MEIYCIARIVSEYYYILLLISSMSPPGSYDAPPPFSVFITK